MTITPGKPLPGLATYWVVRGTVTVPSGKKVTGEIGIVKESGALEIWYPGTSVPKGYKEAALRKLEQAKVKLGFSRHGRKTVRRKHRY